MEGRVPCTSQRHVEKPSRIDPPQQLYSRTKSQLPNKERMDNLSWRMMSMNLRQQQLQAQSLKAQYVCRTPAAKRKEILRLITLSVKIAPALQTRDGLSDWSEWYREASQCLRRQQAAIANRVDEPRRPHHPQLRLLTCRHISISHH